MAKRGPKPKTIDYEKVHKLAMIHCTDNEIAHLVDMTPEGFCKRKKWDDELVQCLEKGRDEGKASLRRLQWKQAQEGDRTMLVWLGKQLLGQRDKHDQTVDQSVSIEIVKPKRD